MVIELPINDYISKYEKSASKAIEIRNVRATIPQNLIVMVRNLKERNLDSKLLDYVLDVIYETIVSRIGEKNSLRLAKAFIKQRKVFESEADYMTSVNEKMNVRVID